MIDYEVDYEELENAEYEQECVERFKKARNLSVKSEKKLEAKCEKRAEAKNEAKLSKFMRTEKRREI